MFKVIFILTMALTFIPGSAFAQAACGEYTDIVNKLNQKYSEKPISMGLGNNGAMIEVFASTKGTFTIVITRPNGISCLVAAGESWENIPTSTAEIQS